MRVAAGIILIASGIVGLVGVTLGLTGFFFDISVFPPILPWRIISGGFLVAGGVFCLMKRYWRLCLASALLALLIGVSSGILSIVGPLLYGPFWQPWFDMVWGTWVVAGGGLVSTIFVFLTKKVWQKSAASLDVPGGQHLRGEA